MKNYRKSSYHRRDYEKTGRAFFLISRKICENKYGLLGRAGQEEDRNGNVGRKMAMHDRGIQG